MALDDRLPRRVLLMISSMRGGGSERQTLLLLQHLDRSLFEPQLYVTERAGDLLAHVPTDVRVHAYSDQSQVAGFYLPGRAAHRQSRNLEQLLHRERIEIIYDRTFHMTMIAGPAASRCRIPRVSTIVSPPALAVPSVESRFIWLKRQHLARAYRQSRCVVAVSRQSAQSAERYYGLPDGSVDIIRNPVDQVGLEAMADRSTIERDDRLTFVCVGRMTKEKGHRDLIEGVKLAAARWPSSLPPIHLWMIGDGPLRNELVSQWESYRGSHCVEFLGNQANPAPFIRAADALVLPSHFEGMPNVVLEAMALGTPVIATQVGGTVELQRDQPTVLWATPHHPQSLADSMLEFASNRAAAHVRADAAKVLVEYDHGLNKCLARIESRLLCACGDLPRANDRVGQDGLN